MGCTGAKEHERLFVDLFRMINGADQCKQKDNDMLHEELQNPSKSMHPLVREKRDEIKLAENILNHNKETYRCTLNAVLFRLRAEIDVLLKDKQQLDNKEQFCIDGKKKMLEYTDMIQKGCIRLDELSGKMSNQLTRIPPSTAEKPFGRQMIAREEKLAAKFNATAKEVAAFTNEITKENREHNAHIQKEIDELRANIAKMTEANKEYQKWRAVIVKQNNFLIEDIDRYELVSQRKLRVENALGGSGAILSQSGIYNHIA